MPLRDRSLAVTARRYHTNMCSSRKRADLAHAEYSAARGRLLRAVAELAETGDWHGDGAGNLAAWLSARWQISYPTARELVREAEAFRDRPAVGDALAAGSISVDQSKALAVLAEPGDDAVWVESLSWWSLPELQREARKKVARELERRDDGIYLRMEHTPDERYMRGAFQLHPEDGAAVLKAIEAGIPSDTPLRVWDRAAALSLVEMAKGSTCPATVVVTTRAVGDGVAELDSHGYVGAETVSRLACDARVQTVTVDESDAVVGIGRTSRSVPPWLRRVVDRRDHGVCTFPGCGLDKHLECHHIVPWSTGGPTDVSNLLTTCWKHHKLLHEGGWSVIGEPGPSIRWVRPDGSPFEPRVRVVLDTC